MAQVAVFKGSSTGTQIEEFLLGTSLIQITKSLRRLKCKILLNIDQFEVMFHVIYVSKYVGYHLQV